MFNLDNILYVPALTSIIFLIAGFIMYIFPPKKINHLCGYRTNSSMKSQERWDFSQKYSSVQMIKMGIAMFVISLFFSFFSISEYLNFVIGLVVVFGAVAFMFYNVEKAIKVNFSNK